MNDFGYIQLGLRGKCAAVPRGRGRPKGSKNQTPAHAPRMNIKGAATSAAKLNGTAGMVDYSDRLWIPGEGWVKWVELKRQVAAAYEVWRVKKAAEGIKIIDAWELKAADIKEAMERRAAA